MTTKQKMKWFPEDTPPELHFMLDELGGAYPVRRGQKPNVCFRRRMQQQRDMPVAADTILYSTLTEAAHGVARFLDPAGGRDVPRLRFQRCGAMLDCSRNAVPTVAYLKHWIRRLALFGFNTFYLYLEDVYELEDEPFFGYQRGRYSASEIREVARTRCGSASN